MTGLQDIFCRRALAGSRRRRRRAGVAAETALPDTVLCPVTVHPPPPSRSTNSTPASPNACTGAEKRSASAAGLRQPESQAAGRSNQSKSAGAVGPARRAFPRHQDRHRQPAGHAAAVRSEFWRLGYSVPAPAADLHLATRASLMNGVPKPWLTSFRCPRCGVLSGGAGRGRRNTEPNRRQPPCLLRGLSCARRVVPPQILPHAHADSAASLPVAAACSSNCALSSPFPRSRRAGHCVAIVCLFFP